MVFIPGGKRDLQFIHAAVQNSLDRSFRSRFKHFQHRFIRSQYVSLESFDPPVLRNFHEGFKEKCCNPFSLKSLINHERHIGIGPVVKTYIPRFCDDSSFTRSPHETNNGHDRSVIYIDIILHFGMGHGFNGREVAIIDRLIRKPVKKVPHFIHVRRLDGSETNRQTVLECLGPRKFLRIKTP